MVLDAAPTSLELTSPVTAMKLGASRLGLATVTRTRRDARSFDGPEERTDDVLHLSDEAADVLPIEASSTLRGKRSSLESEATEVHIVASEATSLLDLSALPDDPPGDDGEATVRPGARATAPTHARRGTYLPVAGPDVRPSSPEVKGRVRASTAPIEFDGVASPSAVESTYYTQRPVIRPSTIPPPSRPSVLPSSLPPPSPAEVARAFADIPTDPGLAPPTAPVHAPLAPREDEALEAGIPWWVPALGVAVIVTLAVAVFSSLR